MEIDLSSLTNLLNQLLPVIVVLSILPAIFKMLSSALQAL